MKNTQVTLRNVDKDLKQLIDQNARKQHKSINQYVLDVLKERVGYSTKQTPAWRKFSGSLPADAISSDALADFEKIDPEMWQ